LVAVLVIDDVLEREGGIESKGVRWWGRWKNHLFI
jgi:hypothetical protein